MKTKLKNNKIYMFLLCAIMMIAALFGIGTSIETANAATSTSPKYKTYGSYSTGGAYTSGCPSNFAIYMYSSYQSGSGTIYNDRVLNWTYVNIYLDVSDMEANSSFKLTRNGSTYSSKTLSGKADQSLYAGSLPDGDYELTYVGTYKKNIFYSRVTYTYKYSFTIDKTAPSYTLKKGTTTVYSGSYVNQQITYSVTDAFPYRVYYKRPGYSSYYSTSATSYSVAATEANNGWWYFYAQDTSLNTNSTVSVYLDTIKPVGSVTNSSGYSVANGGYTNKAVKYSATDAGGVSYYQVMKPGSSSWVSYSAGTLLSGSYGWYTFRAVDKAGNISDEYKVYYDASSPTGTLYAGTTAKSSGSYVNASYIKYVASNGNSGISNCYVRMPNSSYYTSYASGTQLATEGTYYFYTVTNSGTQSPVVSITLDKTRPTGTLYGGTSSIASGSSTNAAYVRFVPYDAIGISATYVKVPGSSSYTTYSSGTRYTAEGQYSFYVVDRAGNVSSTYTVTINRQIPAAQLYVDDVEIGNNSYTNGWHIKFVCAETCYVKLPNSDEFVSYMSGAEYYKPGKYVFYGVDSANNSTGYYTIVIDQTKKPLEIQNVTDGFTNGDVVMDWTDGDANVYAPIVSVTINGKPYVKGNPIYTIDTGVYEVKSVDAAGNVWETTFESTKTNVLTKTLQQQYFETLDATGEYRSFSTYEAAYTYAVNREKTLVRTGTWNNSDWDAGIAMDAKDSANAVNGTYMIYKKEGNPEAEVAYFTTERLNEVLNRYAAQSIKSYYYWEKDHAEEAEGEKLYQMSDGRVVMAKEIALTDNTGYTVDGAEFIGTLYNVNGNHSLVVFDEWGNTCDYDLIVVQTPAEIHYSVGEGSSNLVEYNRTYYFKAGIKVTITDDLDDFAMFVMYNEEGELLGKVKMGDSFEITESGKYTVQSINHYGYSEEFNLIISNDAPSSKLNANAVDKRLEIDITESVDKDSHIQTLEIYKSNDGGTTWTLVTHDDYGTPVSLETLEYSFRTTAMYKVVITDEFRTGIDSIVKTYDYVQPEPVGELNGTTNGGTTNGAVSFSWTDEAIVTLEKLDGAGRSTMMYKSGEEITVDGKYMLTFENYDGYKMVYTFTIDTIKPVIDMQGAESGITTRSDVTMTFDETGLTTELFKDDVSLGEYVSGTVITESGSYRLVIKDSAENTVEVIFVIDKVVDFDINVNDKGLANDITINANEEVTFEISKDGQVLEYELGETIAVPGVYTLKISDTIGNEEEMTFTIVKPLVSKFEHNFDDMEGFELALVNGSEKRLNYGTLELFEDGQYEVGVVANGMTYTFNITVDGTKPTLKLNGVADGGVTESTVTISDISEEATIQVTFNNENMLYEEGDAFTMEGKYVVRVTDTCGNFTEYTFQIKKSNSTGITAIAIIAGVAILGAVVFIILKKKKVF